MEYTFGEKAKEFYESLTPPSELPNDVDPITPYNNPEAKRCLHSFLAKYFSDTKKRILVLGINPGRFGSGVTSVPFTDPVALRDTCGIQNLFQKRRELSSRFIYTIIKSFGGPEIFFRYFFLSAVSPIGFIRDGVNYNYYSTQSFFELVKPFITNTIQQQYDLGVYDTCVLLGVGENEEHFKQINGSLQLFDNFYSLPHPRYIMQYKRKSIDRYTDQYKDVLTSTIRETMSENLDTFG